MRESAVKAAATSATTSPVTAAVTAVIAQQPRRRIWLGKVTRSIAICAAVASIPGLAHAWPWDPQTWADVKKLVRRKFPNAPLITVGELKSWLDDGSQPQPILLDARTRREFDESQLKGALNAETVSAALSLLQGRPKDTPIVVYCSVGYRSGAVAQALIENGYTRTRNLEGSLFEWANSGLPVYQGNRPVTKVHPYDANWGKLLKRELWSLEP